MNDDFVTIATFGSALEAEMARNKLDAEGIRALVMDRETSAMAWHLTQAIGGVKLLVAADDEDRAIAVLDRRTTAEPAQVDDSPPDESEAVVAQENLDKVEPQQQDEPEEEPPTARELNAERAFKAQIFAFLFFPLQFVALVFIVQVAASQERLEGRPRRQFRNALILHPFAWLFFWVMWLVLSR
jgi:hypothetical protein